MSKHTPEEWHITQMWVDGTGPVNNPSFRIDGHNPTTAEIRRRTALIKAAPGLLEACEGMMRCKHKRPGYLCPQCVGKLAAKMDSAIAKAKARGGTHE
jgi:hypothetical protein